MRQDRLQSLVDEAGLRPYLKFCQPLDRPGLGPFRFWGAPRPGLSLGEVVAAVADIPQEFADIEDIAALAELTYFGTSVPKDLFPVVTTILVQHEKLAGGGGYLGIDWVEEKPRLALYAPHGGWGVLDRPGLPGGHPLNRGSVVTNCG